MTGLGCCEILEHWGINIFNPGELAPGVKILSPGGSEHALSSGDGSLSLPKAPPRMMVVFPSLDTSRDVMARGVDGEGIAGERLTFLPHHPNDPNRPLATICESISLEPKIAESIPHGCFD